MTAALTINIAYIVASVLFILGLKMMSRPDSARQGNFLSALGMALAIAATLLTKGLEFEWVVIGGVIGTLIGAFFATRVQMTQMPEMVALLNGFGGLASLLVGWSAYHYTPQAGILTTSATFLSVLIGGVTFSGSLVAWAKLHGNLPSRPLVFQGQQLLNGFLLVLIMGIALFFLRSPATFSPLFVALVILSLLLGITSVLPIGGADMPVVISLLNSYSGLAACAAGFVILNNILIVAGALVGASGIILTQIMCKAMNRSLRNVLFSGFGSVVKKTRADKKGEVRPLSPEDAYLVLEAARSVVITPGYGLAVAQAQHVVRELGELLEKNGAEVRYAIHPVAGRMPGHMNVLLAEANVPYDQLVEMDAVNPAMDAVDVCIVIGANDTVNPAALHDKTSPIYGMPIIETFRARTVFVIKRSMATGFAGIENDLFTQENTRMIFGDAKDVVQKILSEFKSK
ncbi:MAG: NAD(P)(+) transhydrogenase (Re/Si-specific) subunit beta [Elusimicrobia bacterium]|nr:NAD(P)(+) transhydrogenase (Re/Si-specific) subunit beta [Elusimicrobiota bacterium]